MNRRQHLLVAVVFGLALATAPNRDLIAQVLATGELPSGMEPCVVTQPVPPGQAPPPSLPSIEALCGALEVPERWDGASERTIRVKVVVVPSASRPARPDPVVWLNGGPGFASTPAAPGFAPRIQSAITDRDIVFIDQRGDPGSGDLMCLQEYREPTVPLQMLVGRAFSPEWLHACMQRLQDEHDLTQYTTRATVRDLEAIREWLGYDRWNLWGLSYGSRVAQAYAKTHPDRLRTMILDAVVPLDYGMPTPFPSGLESALELAVSTCELDADCSRAFPHLRPDLAAIRAQLRKAYVVASAPDPRREGSEPTPVLLDGTDVALVFRAMLYGQGVANLPLIVTRAAAGDWTMPVRVAAGTAFGRPNGTAIGLYTSVVCSEDLPSIGHDAAVERTVGTLMGPTPYREARTVCDFWPSDPAPPEFYEPFTGDTPTLLFSGQFDPATPPKAGEAVARHLPNAHHVVVPYGGHGSGSHPPARECTLAILRAFIESGSPRALDTSCLASIAPPVFQIGS